jgi:hypothetical protein
LNRQKSFTSATEFETPANHGRALAVIIGFDAEWVEEQPCSPPRNRVLSYQYAGRCNGREWSGIVYTRAGARIRYPDASEADIAAGPDRIKLGILLGSAIQHGIKEGHLKEWPKAVIAAAHWTRADLSVFADFENIKRQFDCLHNTYATVKKPYRAKVNVAKHRREFAVTLVDTSLLTPGGSKELTALGRLYNFDRLDPGHRDVVNAAGDLERIHYIEHMDRLLNDDPECYEAYAIRDAEICVRHADEIMRFGTDELGLNLSTPPPTLGSLAVEYLMKVWVRERIDHADVTGQLMTRVKRFNRRAGRYITKRKLRRVDRYENNRHHAEKAFHGGRNECFWYGPTPNLESDCAALFREFDVTSAYATAMASIKIPDYKNARATTEPADFHAAAIGFAHVRFYFPAQTRFPSLPVVASDERGLVYPLAGEAYVTAPEIAVARHLGADIEIIDGVVVPWCSNQCCRPFMVVINDLINRRQRHKPGTLSNEMFKQMANSLYGKLGQGITGRTSYSTRDDRPEEIGPSNITNPFIAAHVTGLIRALVSELIASIPHQRTVISVTTDGFITNAPLCEIGMSGPVASHLIDVRRMMTAALDQHPNNSDNGLLGVKYAVPRLLPWRTRGVATLASGHNPDTLSDQKPKLARGGMRAPPGTKDENAWFVRELLTRKPGQKYTSREPLPFSMAHRTNADHVFRERERTANFEYDFKRQLIGPRLEFVTVPSGGPEDDLRIVQHISCATIPWPTIEAFNDARDQFEKWKKCGRQLKTIADWRNWQNFQAGSDASRAGIRRSARGLVGQAKRLLLRAYGRRKWGLPGGDYRKGADSLTAAGYPTTEQDFKNALRARLDPPEKTIPADAPGISNFVRAVLSIWPEFAWTRLLKDAGPNYLREQDPMPQVRKELTY